MAVKLHRCSTRWKFGPCWRVQKALNEQGIDYEIVKGPSRPGKRVELERLSGQRFYPVIEFENGSVYREESKDMAAMIRAGRLDENAVRRRSPTVGRFDSCAAPSRWLSQKQNRLNLCSRAKRFDFARDFVQLHPERI